MYSVPQIVVHIRGIQKKLDLEKNIWGQNIFPKC